jgi:hypothetical protein
MRACLSVLFQIFFFLSAWTPTGYLLIFATYKQQMERRSVRIQQRRERLAERQDLGDEEHIAPPPGGRQNRGRQHNQRHGTSNHIGIISQ